MELVSMSLGRIVALLALIGAVSPVVADEIEPIAGIRAHIKPKSYRTPLGSPVWVQLTLENTTNTSITLTVPGTDPDIPVPEMGLPLAHVFSGPSASGISVTTTSSRRWEVPVGYRAPDSAPILMIAPHSTVGTSIDLRDYFPTLRSAGEYRLAWAPYGGRVKSDTVVLNITPLKRAEIITDEGTMVVRLLYEDAPQTVANFIELAEAGFYNGKVFHRIEPGYFIQGGCPRGDGTGIRSDGKRVLAEFNANPHRKGSLSMALLSNGNDPDSASCQFFICNTRQKEWDGKYTVFGYLEGDASYETLERLMAIPVDDESRPTRTIYMRTIRTINAPAEPLVDSP